jgi:hypothetical protein
MGNCLGLISTFLLKPSPLILDIADDGLTAGGDVHTLDDDLLLPLAAMPIQSFDEHGMGAGEFAGLGEVFTTTLKRQGGPYRPHRGSRNSAAFQSFARSRAQRGAPAGRMIAESRPLTADNGARFRSSASLTAPSFRELYSER